MKQILLTLAMLFCATLSFAQELKVKSFVHNATNLEARVDGRTDLNGKQCALIKVMVRDNIIKCKGGNIGDIVTEGVVKKIFVTPDSRFLELEFQYNFPLKVTFSDHGIKNLAEGATYTLTLVDAYMLSQQSSQQNNTHTMESEVQQTQPEQPSQQIEKTVPNPNAIPIEVNGVTFYMIKVEGGTFKMGEMEPKNSHSNERPAHQVTLSSYCIGETEVTQALWKAVMGSNPSHFIGDNLPVEMVSWNDCQDFIRRLNEITYRKFRLPTEAEWEFAARGGNMSNHTQYSGSKRIKNVAWYEGNSGRKTHLVKTKKPNELGLYDMSGNVWEWCQDWYGTYSSNAQTNPTGPGSGSYRVDRGGSWNSIERSCRSSCRYSYSPGFRSDGLGFRLALSE